MPDLEIAWASMASMVLADMSRGCKIVEILKKNPKKEPSKYDKNDLGHMRKVAASNKRHLAQEQKS